MKCIRLLFFFVVVITEDVDTVCNFSFSSSSARSRLSFYKEHQYQPDGLMEMVPSFLKFKVDLVVYVHSLYLDFESIQTLIISHRHEERVC